MEIIRVLRSISSWRLQAADEVDDDSLTLAGLAQWRINLYKGTINFLLTWDSMREMIC